MTDIPSGWPVLFVRACPTCRKVRVDPTERQLLMAGNEQAGSPPSTEFSGPFILDWRVQCPECLAAPLKSGYVVGVPVIPPGSPAGGG